MTYADTYKRRSELAAYIQRSERHATAVADAMYEHMRERRLMLSARHMAHRVRLARVTAYQVQ